LVEFKKNYKNQTKLNLLNLIKIHILFSLLHQPNSRKESGRVMESMGLARDIAQKELSFGYNNNISCSDPNMLHNAYTLTQDMGII